MSSSFISPASTGSIQDRTLEFQQCVSSYSRLNKSKQKNYQPPQRQNESAKQQLSRTEFTNHAKGIAKELAHVTELLSKLALLTKRNQFLDDRSTEILELTYVIKQNMFKLEKSLIQLATDSQSKNVNDQISLHTKNVVQLLNTRTKNISEEFKTVLQLRQKTELLNKTRKEQFLSMASESIQNNHDITQKVNSPRIVSDNPFLSSMSDPLGELMEGNGSGQLLSIPDQSQQLMLLEEQQLNVYLQERNRAVETIESTINEVGNLFQQLATMVNEQGEQIQRIDTNVEDISLNIQGAQRELLKYYNHVSNNRWFMLKIFAVIIFFFMIWVLVS